MESVHFFREKDELTPIVAGWEQTKERAAGWLGSAHDRDWRSIQPPDPKPAGLVAAVVARPGVVPNGPEWQPAGSSSLGSWLMR
jgi:hypothetical protein